MVERNFLHPVCIFGILLFLFGVLLIPLGLRLRQPFREENLIQDIILSLMYIASGGYIFFQGWELDPILASYQILLIVSTFYGALKDMLYRS